MLHAWHQPRSIELRSIDHREEREQRCFNHTKLRLQSGGQLIDRLAPTLFAKQRDIPSPERNICGRQQKRLPNDKVDTLLYQGTFSRLFDFASLHQSKGSNARLIDWQYFIISPMVHAHNSLHCSTWPTTRYPGAQH